MIISIEAQTDAEGQERRKHRRQATRFDARLKECLFDMAHAHPVDARILDLAPDGAGLVARGRWKKGMVLQLNMNLPGWGKYNSSFFKGEVPAEAPLMALAQVVWTELTASRSPIDQKQRLGVRFVGIDDGHQLALKRYLRRMS